MVVYCPEPDSAFRDLAAEIAEVRGERVVTEPPSDPRDGRVVYVAPPTEITAADVLPLQRRLVVDGPDDAGFGIVTGETASAARSLYFDRRAGSDRDRHAIMLRDETGDWFCSDDDCEVFVGDEVSVATLRERMDDLASLSMLSHGRPIHLYLNDGYVCGFPPSGDVDEYDGPQPFCVTDGRVDCPLAGDMLTAADVVVPHQFVDSCSSMLPSNDSSGLPVHVGTWLLDGADSLVSGYRQLDSISQIPLLHYCLLRAGYDVAERCYLLNRAAHAYDTAAYPYVAFGRPEAATRQPTYERYDYRREGNRLVFTELDTPVVDVTLDDVPADDSVYVANRTDRYADAPLYYAAFREGDAARLLVFTWGRIQAERLAFEVTVGRPEHSRYRRIHDALRQADRLNRLGFLDRKARGQLKDLENRVKGVTADDHAQRYDANVYRDVAETLDQLDDRVEGLQDRIADRLDRRKSSYLTDSYREEFRRTATTAEDGGCPDCSRPLFLKTMADTANETVRVRAICPNCGVVFDAPVHEDAPLTYPGIVGEFFQVPRDSRTFDVQFRNARDVPVTATAVPWLSAEPSQVGEDPVFSPGRTTTRLQPDESLSATFELDLAEVEPNEYWLSAFVVANLAVYQRLTKLVVGDAVGHLRVDLRDELE
jgi:hypothetical protein